MTPINEVWQMPLKEFYRWCDVLEMKYPPEKIEESTEKVFSIEEFQTLDKQIAHNLRK